MKYTLVRTDICKWRMGTASRLKRLSRLWLQEGGVAGREAMVLLVGMRVFGV